MWNRLSFGAGEKVIMDKRSMGKGAAGDKAAGKVEQKKAGKDGEKMVKVTHKVKKDLKK